MIKQLLPLSGLLVLACTNHTSGGSSLDDDKADDGTRQSCVAEHDEWLLTQYAPLQCDEGPACVGRVEQQSRPTCDGQPSYAAWNLIWEKHILTPILLRQYRAYAEFVDADSTVRGYERYVEQTAPTAAELAAHNALLSIRSSADAFDYQSWLGSYDTLLSTIAVPLHNRATTVFSADGRNVCGTPFDFDAVACQAEPVFYFNSSELALLDMMEASAPTVNEDGSYAAWLGLYRTYLTSTETNLIAFEFPRLTERGLAKHELDFFARLRSIRPTPQGEQDSERWMVAFNTLLAGANLSRSDEVLQLSLLEMARPNPVVGLPAYRSWLGTDFFQLGFAFFSTDDATLGRLLPVMPCARNAQELASFTAAYESYLPTPGGADVEVAAPFLCASEPSNRSAN